MDNYQEWLYEIESREHCDDDREQWELNQLTEDEYWDCLEIDAPREVLEDCPQ
ncbi:hypothetical protein [Synechococcus sp. PCC 6312]|uniref:hypothetical protein n=1 Tax=Synechococcus sp. (strain ATCC 27167 / PCC 6312) TaxID=195253 RepID=UPI00029EFCDA|nr:hypothetical protein [Synechococcus sp. PCC 6312]AFY60078.1 hypothetical protein Syn6312_0870 [Synechococcus sp. PCC 6312]